MNLQGWKAERLKGPEAVKAFLPAFQLFSLAPRPMFLTSGAKP
jgi:hypothetical protein